MPAVTPIVTKATMKGTNRTILVAIYFLVAIPLVHF